jgi:nicotinamidase-related amidase
MTSRTGRRSALLVIDVQESFRQLPSWASISDPDIVDHVDHLLRASRERGDLVVWILHSEPDSDTPFDPASGHVQPIAGLQPRPNEPVLTKYVHNAFTTTSLHLLLTRHGVGRVTVCGIRTEQCCETTARLASDLGYEVVFVTEATATTPLPHPDLPAGTPWEQVLADPRTLPVQDVIARTEYALAGRFATIATLTDAVAGLPPRHE